MCPENDSLNEKLSEGILDCREEKKFLKDDLATWTDALAELSEIEDGFQTSELRMAGKTILDVGTDAVKPLYIALKLKPRKIIGINEDLRPFVSDIELKSKIFAGTEIKFYTCSFFDKVTLEIIRDREEIKEFDFVLVSKTLHHLRDGKCVEEHKCQENEKCCKYRFNEEEIFKKLLGLGKRVIIYEFFEPAIEDDDKIRGRGGYFTANEWIRIFKHLSANYRVVLIRPKKFQLHRENIDREVLILRQVDCICFYVEEQKRAK